MNEGTKYKPISFSLKLVAEEQLIRMAAGKIVHKNGIIQGRKRPWLGKSTYGSDPLMA